MSELPARSQIAETDTWDLAAIYSSDADWETDFNLAQQMLPHLEALQGTLRQSAERLLDCLTLRDRLFSLVEQLLVYAKMRGDEDNTDSFYQGLGDRAEQLYTKAQSLAAYVLPEILAIPTDIIDQYLGRLPGLQVYNHFLADLMRQKAHILPPELEVIFAEAGELGRAPEQIFSMLYEADLKLPQVTDENGAEVELTKGRFQRFLESQNRNVRREAFQSFYGSIKGHQHTLTAIYNAQVKADRFFARGRRYESTLAASLFPDNIPVKVYTNLVQTVNNNLETLHRYLRLRKRILGLEQLHMYDLYVPLAKELKQDIAYTEAAEMVKAALHPLGEDYLAVLQHGLNSRWIDVYENAGKTGGAYSWGPYTSHPFILLNYQNRLGDVFTLAHELGHSLHSHYTRNTQPYIYGHYTIFVAEVASTLNEILLTQHLLRVTSDPAVRRYVLNHYLESFRTTLFRQTMFAEFEQIAHARAEAGEPLTLESLCAIHRELNKRYYGPAVLVDPEIDLEWMRIPHFYKSFYVFQYATGISAAVALSQQILDGGAPATRRYLTFLRGGGADYPINLLRQAGVNMETPEPIQAAIDVFSGLIDQMEQLV